MVQYSSKNLKNARTNRRQRNATRQEGILWHSYLKSHSTRFLRQYRVLSYILDFYAPKLKLCIEIDGGQHYDDATQRYDEERTRALAENGIVVLRFTNDDVDKNLNGTILAIEEKIKELRE